MHVFGKMTHVKLEIVAVSLPKQLVNIFLITLKLNCLYVLGHKVNVTVSKLMMN